MNKFPRAFGLQRSPNFHDEHPLTGKTHSKEGVNLEKLKY